MTPSTPPEASPGTPFARLQGEWRATGEGLYPGASDREIEQFEARHGVQLPGDMREFYQQVNGMDLDSIDWNHFRFMPLSEVAPASEGFGRPTDTGIFTFVDYMFASHGYAIALDSQPAEANHVFIVWDEEPVRVANSFSEFIHACLDDYESLFPDLP